MEDKQLHEGHRARLRRQVRERGLEGMPDHNILEFLLFYTIARRDVNPLAHALIERFGSLSAVLDAPIEELMRVPGCSEVTAVFLSTLPKVFRAYQQDKLKAGVLFTDAEGVGDYLAKLFVGRRVETLIMLCLDLKNKLICWKVVADGSVAHVSFPIRRIVELALSAGAVSIAIAHNHPGGFAIPSRGDIEATGKLRDALSPLGIALIDHVVVSEDDYTSMRLSGYL